LPTFIRAGVIASVPTRCGWMTYVRTTLVVSRRPVLGSLTE
jgi:hypothetical protein